APAVMASATAPAGGTAPFACPQRCLVLPQRCLGRRGRAAGRNEGRTTKRATPASEAVATCPSRVQRGWSKPHGVPRRPVGRAASRRCRSAPPPPPSRETAGHYKRDSVGRRHAQGRRARRNGERGGAVR